MLNYLPPASVTVFDRGQSTAAIYVEIYTKESSSERRPHLELRPQDSPIWFQYFADQFDAQWAVGRPYEGETGREPG